MLADFLQAHYLITEGYKDPARSSLGQASKNTWRSGQVAFGKEET